MRLRAALARFSRAPASHWRPPSHVSSPRIFVITRGGRRGAASEPSLNCLSEKCDRKPLCSDSTLIRSDDPLGNGTPRSRSESVDGRKILVICRKKG